MDSHDHDKALALEKALTLVERVKSRMDQNLSDEDNIVVYNSVMREWYKLVDVWYESYLKYKDVRVKARLQALGIEL